MRPLAFTVVCLWLGAEWLAVPTVASSGLLGVEQFLLSLAGALTATWALTFISRRHPNESTFALVLLISAAKLFQLGTSIDPNQLAGLITGSTAGAWLTRQAQRRRAGLVLGVVALAYAFSILAPFEMRQSLGPFEGNFATFNETPAAAYVATLAANAFLFSAALAVFASERAAVIPATVALALIAALGECARALIVGRPPQPVQIALVFCVGLLISIVGPRRNGSSGTGPRQPVRSPMRGHDPSSGHAARGTRVPRNSNLPNPTDLRLQWTLLAGCAVLIAYASFYPMSAWTKPQAPLWSFLMEPWPRTLSRSDLIANVLGYIPFGLLLGWIARQKMGILGSILLGTGTGLAFSFLAESLQMFLPGRVPSKSDLLANTAGSAIGAFFALICQAPAMAGMLKRARSRWLVQDVPVEPGMAAMLLWALSQLSPFTISIDTGTIKEGVASLIAVAHMPSLFQPPEAIVYALNLLGLALLVSSLFKPGQAMILPFALVAGSVLCLKIFIPSRQLSPEAAAGHLAALVMLIILRNIQCGPKRMISLLSITLAFCFSELTPVGGPVQPFDWTPFAGELQSNVNAVSSILGGIWPFLALGALVRMMAKPGAKRRSAWAGLLIVTLLSFAVEWTQQYLPGRQGGITVVLLALVGWAAAWRLGKDPNLRRLTVPGSKENHES